LLPRDNVSSPAAAYGDGEPHSKVPNMDTNSRAALKNKKSVDNKSSFRQNQK